jgi:hypothetical protein
MWWEGVDVIDCYSEKPLKENRDANNQSHSHNDWLIIRTLYISRMIHYIYGSTFGSFVLFLLSSGLAQLYPRKALYLPFKDYTSIFSPSSTASSDKKPRINPPKNMIEVRREVLPLARYLLLLCTIYLGPPANPKLRIVSSRGPALLYMSDGILLYPSIQVKSKDLEGF